MFSNSLTTIGYNYYILFFFFENCPLSFHIKAYFLTSKSNLWTLGNPISKLVLCLPEATLSYLSKVNWSVVKSGLGNNWKIMADNLAIINGIGISNLFFSTSFNNFFNISFKEIIYGPTHSIVTDLIFFEITWKIISVKSEQCIGINFVLPL